ncbi:MAG TPA: hypothetical protein PK409_03080 [Thermosynergistes sp.]|nr:hypothetical protein [Thermosynergistes sp.]HXK89285.1 hypothetical protein [Thermosynergistes sp.]
MTYSSTLTSETLWRTDVGVMSPLLSDASLCFVERKCKDGYESPQLLTVFMSPVSREKSTAQVTEVISSKWETGFTPQTVLGKKLIALRNKAIAAGVQLLSEEEVLEEVKRRRGELEGDEADLY